MRDRVTARDPLPKLLTDAELRDVLGLGHSQFYKRKALGHFRHFEVTPQLPHSRTRYSGRKVQDWCDRQDTRFFRSHLTRRSA